MTRSEPTYLSERTEPYQWPKHSLRDHYRVDTERPFDIAMYRNRGRVADIQYRHQARRFPRVPTERRRRDVPWAEVAALAIIFGLGALFFLIFSRYPIVQG